MSRARESALRLKYGKKKSAVGKKPIDWQAYEQLLSCGKQPREIAKIFDLRPETVAARCKTEFGVVLAVKFSHLMADGYGRKTINWDLAKKYFALCAPIEEVADALGVHALTLARRCAIEHKMTLKEWANGCASKTLLSLRQKQITVAMGRDEVVDPQDFNKVLKSEVHPNGPMLMHLGRHLLGQVEKSDITMAVTGVSEERKTELKGLLGIMGAGVVASKVAK